ncbi:MAG: subtilisin, partial [Acidobacteriota bacterium]
MRQLVAITVILVLATTLPAFADRSEEVGAAVAVPSPEPVAGPSWPGPRGAVLVDNGPLVNVPGGGAGGADLSMLENVTLGMTSLGLANQGPGDTGNRVSDDFTVTGEGWILDECTFYAYQTGAPNAPSPISAINVQVWDGAPDDPASMVVAGDLTTNIQTDSAWSNIYRAAEDDTAGTLRAIFAITADMGGLELAAGDYWFDWAPTGSATFSGPWAPPIAILG